MMQEKAIRTLGGWGIGVLLGLGAACAGGDTPPRTDELEQEVAVKFAGAQVVAAAGGGGSSGTGGSGGTAANPPAGGGSGGSGAMAAAGSGGMDPPAGTGGSGSNECDGFALLQSKCSGSSCHSGGSLTTFVESEDAAKDFAGQTSSICVGQGDMSPIFDPETPAASLVVKKITGSTSCGLRMPLGAQMQAYTDAELDCIEAWIGSL